MATWTMEQVGQVRGLRAVLHLSAERVEHWGAEVQDAARGKMARQLVEMARPFAVEPHPGDFVVDAERPDATLWDIRLTCRWRPTTNAAILLGGPKDGEKWAIQKIGEPFVVEVMQSLPWVEHDATCAESAISHLTVRYELAGWHEAERCWIYEAQ